MMADGSSDVSTDMFGQTVLTKNLFFLKNNDNNKKLIVTL